MEESTPEIKMAMESLKRVVVIEDPMSLSTHDIIPTAKIPDSVVWGSLGALKNWANSNSPKCLLVAASSKCRSEYSLLSVDRIKFEDLSIENQEFPSITVLPEYDEVISILKKLGHGLGCFARQMKNPVGYRCHWSSRLCQDAVDLFRHTSSCTGACPDFRCKPALELLRHYRNCGRFSVDNVCPYCRDILNAEEEEGVEDEGLCTPSKKARREVVEAPMGVEIATQVTPPPSPGPAEAESEVNLPWTPDDVKNVLGPVLNAVLLNSEAHYFLQKNKGKMTQTKNKQEDPPKDLNSVHRKLENFQYTNPWNFCDDIWFILENTGNDKKSAKSKAARVISELVRPLINSAMQRLGLCCGQQYLFHPHPFPCSNKPACRIREGSMYFRFKDDDEIIYSFCRDCFKRGSVRSVYLSEPESDHDSDDSALLYLHKIPKSRFRKLRHDKIEPELFVDCGTCGRQVHQICVGYVESLWTEGYICDRCLDTNNQHRRSAHCQFSATKLPENQLSKFIQHEVNQELTKEARRKGLDSTADVVIRVLAHSEKVVQLKSRMKKRFASRATNTGSFQYTSKVIFAFQQRDGKEVCFFGMHVQEYGMCNEPNARHVYLAYLDSVPFFEPKPLRTMAYQWIILGYLKYVKSIGFMMCHIWAAPPCDKEDDYIFHAHPPEQKIPKSGRLQEWYKKLLRLGEENLIIESSTVTLPSHKICLFLLEMH